MNATHAVREEQKMQAREKVSEIGGSFFRGERQTPGEGDQQPKQATWPNAAAP